MVWNPFSKAGKRDARTPADARTPEEARAPKADRPEEDSAGKIPIAVSREGARSGTLDTEDTEGAVGGAKSLAKGGAHETVATNAAPPPHTFQAAGTGADPDPDQEQSASPPSGRSLEAIREDVIGILRTVYDPEIPVNIYELGLVYEVNITPPGDVHIRMTLTSPACPVAGSLPPEVEHKVGSTPGVTSVRVELVWDPPWSPSKMSEAARLQLNV